MLCDSSRRMTQILCPTHHVACLFAASSLNSWASGGGDFPLRYCHSLEKSFTRSVELCLLTIFWTGELTSCISELPPPGVGVMCVMSDSSMPSRLFL